MDTHSQLRNTTANAIRNAFTDMELEFGNDKLFGFALCTDDDVMTLFSAACTQSWVAENKQDYEEIGFIYVEWLQNSGDSHFESISKTVAELSRDDSQSTPEQRFEAFVLALQDCREEGLFDIDTLLCCGSTDPSAHMEMLAMQAVERLNTASNAEQFAKHLGYEEYRGSD